MSSSALADVEFAIDPNMAAMQATNTVLPLGDMVFSLESLQNFTIQWKKLVNEALRSSSLTQSSPKPSQKHTSFCRLGRLRSILIQGCSILERRK
jgi:hypothetical protein